MNQLLLALPVIVMYQIGVLLVWFQNRGRARRAKKEAALPKFEIKPMPQVAQPVVPASTVPHTVVPVPQSAAVRQPVRRVSMDGFAPVKPQIAKPFTKPQQFQSMDFRPQTAPRTSFAQPRQPQPVRPVRPLEPRSLQVPARSVDGFMMHRPGTQIASSS